MKVVSPVKGKKSTDDAIEEIWNLRLYVAGQTRNRITAFANLKKSVKSISRGNTALSDRPLDEDPQLAKGDQIIAIPTLVRKLP